MTSSYPALTIWQPWAWLICHGYKDVENRPWRTGHRGTLLIHAGMTFDPDFDWEWVQDLLSREHSIVMPTDPDAFPRGCIVGRATLVGCFERSERVEGWHAGRGFIDDSPWFTGRFGWALKDARAATELKPCRGERGLFYPDLSKVYAPPARAPRRRRR